VKSVVETLNPTRVKIAVEVPFEELESNIQAAYKRIGGQITVPGFRKGKVPPPIIDQRVGRPVVLEEAINDAMPGLYSSAVNETELEPLGQPEVEITELNDREELKFTAEVSVKPEFELPEWEGLAIEVDSVHVTDEDVNTRLDDLRARFGTLTGVDRAAGDGDFVQIDLNATADGEPIEGGQAEGVSYQIGRGDMIDGLDEALTGLSAGESTTFSTELLGTHAGEQAQCEVTVHTVKEQELPDVDDDFVQMASEFDTLDELKDDLLEQAEREGRLQQAVEARDKVLDTLLDTVGEIPLPEELITQQVDEHMSDGHGEEGHREEFEQDVRRNLTSQFVLDEIVKREEVQVGQEELTQYVLQRAQQRGVDPNELAQQFVQNGQLQAVVADVARGKGLALVVERANVTDDAGAEVDLNNLREDGTIGEPDESEDIVIDGDPGAAEPQSAEPQSAESQSDGVSVQTLSAQTGDADVENVEIEIEEPASANTDDDDEASRR